MLTHYMGTSHQACARPVCAGACSVWHVRGFSLPQTALSASYTKADHPLAHQQRDATAPDPSRRQLVAGIALTALLVTQPACAENDSPFLRGPATAGPNSPVIPALSPGQYVDKIIAARGPAWEDLVRWMEMSKYKEAAESLIIYPFDDIAQSAFYLPWAILEVDENRAVQVSKQGCDILCKHACSASHG